MTADGVTTSAQKQGALTWVDRNYGIRAAAIGRVPLFTASWGLTRDHPAMPVVLRCNLPGFIGEDTYCKDYADAEGQAERILARWLGLIGASFDA